MGAHLRPRQLICLLDIKLFLAERFQDWNVVDGGLPDDLAAHTAIAVSHQISHPLNRPPLDTAGGQRLVLGGQSAA